MKICQGVLKFSSDLDKIWGSNVHKNVLCDCEIYEKRRNERDAVLTGVNKFL
jgi:hypothetical protein